jgi:ubiquinone/menaquinone biosynthesis C-methylase UbiE
MDKSIMNIFCDDIVAQEYDQFYESEKGKAVDRIEKSVVRQLLRSIPVRGNMLELGCGTGHWTKFFCEEGFRVTAIDTSEAMLSEAQKKNIGCATFLRADAAALPFVDESFSVVASITMLEFVEDIHEIFNETDRVLKRDGYLLFGWLNALSELGKKKNSDKIYRHARFYTPDEIRQYLSYFGDPIMQFGVHYSPFFDLLDETDKQDAVHPAFIATLVQKIKR